ncbi:MAG: hypothetical protein JST93_10350 [Acidobacteria bacterium]|nr:hypothetical protein [Acidobacteriota bacterium]
MAEWEFAQRDRSEQLAQVHHFSMVKQVNGEDVEFLITVLEYLTPKDPAMKFFARTDKQVNQNTAPVTPCGWGTTLLQALSGCMEMVRKFPYEG